VLKTEDVISLCVMIDHYGSWWLMSIFTPLWNRYTLHNHRR